MVKAPVVTAFATELPETVPIRPLATTAALPGPPWLRPVRARERSMKKLARPCDAQYGAEEDEEEDEGGRDAKGNAEDAVGPQVLEGGEFSTRENPPWARTPGKYGPKRA